MNQGFPPFKLGNGAHLCTGQLQNILNILGLVLLQIQDDLVFGIVDDGPSVLAIVQTEKVRQVLSGSDCRAAVAPDDLENL